MKTIKTIDITPSRAEHARVCAYALAMHSDTSPYSFGDYWAYTPEQENIIFATYNAVDAIAKAVEATGINFWQSAPKGFKKQVIKSAIETVTASLSNEVTA
jgi:hypothetical protein